MKQLPHHLAAVWFADVVGYSALSEKDEAQALHLVQAFMETTREVVERYGGRVVKFLGDGALAEFPSTDLAVRSAQTLVLRFPEASEAEGLGRRHVRVGVHVGDVAATEDGDLFGDGVNVASRIQALAEPGTVWVSEDARRQLQQRKEFRFEPQGEQEMKGIQRPIGLFTVEVDEEDWSGGTPGKAAERVEAEVERQAAPASKPARVPSPQRRALSLMGIGAVVAIVLIGGAQFLGRGGGGEIAEASVAVLPFENLSGDAENEYFSDGITDDVLTALSKVGGLKVISRTSTLQYKGTTKPIREIAGELEVATILEGTVRRAGDRVRITAQLINATTDEHVWAETYDRDLTDVFAIQSEIAARIADALHVALSQGESASIRAGETSSPEAYDLVLQARERILADPRLSLADRVSNAQAALRMLRRAIELDPEYARAHAGLGNAYSILVLADSRTWADSALAASRRAIELDPNLAEAHVAAGFAQDGLGRVSDAIASYRRAIELDPNNVQARDAAAYLLLNNAGRLDEAVELLLEAVKRDPGDIDRYADVAHAYHYLGLPELAEAWAAEVERRQPDNGLVHAYRGQWALERGDLGQAEAEIAAALDFAPGIQAGEDAALMLAATRGRYEEASRHLEALTRGFAFEYSYIITPAWLAWKTGDRRTADSLFAEGERRSREMIAQAPEITESYVDMARILVTRGDRDAAVDWIERLYQRGYRLASFIRADTRLAELRSDPRFQGILARMDADIAEMRERAPKERP